MAGFMRQPQVINDPNAAPASMRADDVDLQAQEGDFIMGYPAMQQSGPRVRSLVEQAMLKAKDKGVKTKGYKSGDKVDILVHNGEMHIPKQLVSYIDGGYTTLKKLNAPSKHDEGDVVGGQGGRTLSDADIDRKTLNPKFSAINKLQSDIKKSNIKVSAPNQGANEFVKGPHFERLSLSKTQGSSGERIWNQANKKLEKIMKSTAFNKGKYINDMIHTETMTNIKNAIETNGLGDVSLDKLLDTSFLSNAVAGSETNFLLSKANFATGNGQLKSNVRIDETGLEFEYPDGTPHLFASNKKPKSYYDRPERNLPGWKVEYEQLVDFLTIAEGFDKVPRKDKGKWVIGHGHQIKKSSKYYDDVMRILKEEGQISEEFAQKLLFDDIMTAESDARVNYNKHTKSKTFDGLSFNQKIMIMAINYHLGRERASEYNKLSNAIKNNDWASITEESKVKERINGKLEFTKGMKNRHDMFIKQFVTPYFLST
jgi:GH24 family phage-related lysozyme (muramidase)